MGHDRRQILWLGVTAHPTAEWIANQITQACGWDRAPSYLIHDRDACYGTVCMRRVRSLGIRDHPTSARSPWQNGYAERLIGSIRRECLDHIVVFGERHLRHVLSCYMTTMKARNSGHFVPAKRGRKTQRAGGRNGKTGEPWSSDAGSSGASPGSVLLLTRCGRLFTRSGRSWTPDSALHLRAGDALIRRTWFRLFAVRHGVILAFNRPAGAFDTVLRCSSKLLLLRQSRSREHGGCNQSCRCHHSSHILPPC